MGNIPEHKIYLFFALLFGLVYSIITPPFQVSDETNHFFRAYQISEGHFKAIKENGRVGGYIPAGLDSFANQYYKFTLNPLSKLNYAYLLGTKGIPLHQEKLIFKDFPYTAMYSPVSYFPQSITFFFLKLFNCRPFYLLYAARIFTLLFCVFITFFSIKIVPQNKMLFVFLALLPMGLALYSSLSADAVTNALSLFLLAYLLKIAFRTKFFKI